MGKVNPTKEQVLGYTLNVKLSKHGRLVLGKRLFNVVEENESGETAILLVSPKGRSRIRVIQYINPTEKQLSRPQQHSGEGKKSVGVKVTSEEWQKLQNGEIITRSSIKQKSGIDIKRYISLDLDKLLDKLLEFSEHNFDSEKIKAIQEYAI